MLSKANQPKRKNHLNQDFKLIYYGMRRDILKQMLQAYKTPLFLAIASLALLQLPARADYWLVIGSFRQGPGSRPEVSGITSPSVYAIPMSTLQQCKSAGKTISEEIYKPVWQFDNRWTCVYGGD